jgi:SAM-dependent methyltransferase
MPDDYRAVVRAGYDDIAARYLAERPIDGADVVRLEDLLDRLPTRARVLDAGCGTGVPVTSRLLARGFPTVGLDISVAQLVHPGVFAEVRRVLKPGGWTLLCLGARDNPGDHDTESWLGAPMFWSHYDAPTNVRLVRDAGLAVVDDRMIDDPTSHGRQLFVLDRKPDTPNRLSS